MNSAAYDVYAARKVGGRYKFVVRGRSNGKYARKYFLKKTGAATWAGDQNIEVQNQGVDQLVNIAKNFLRPSIPETPGLLVILASARERDKP